MFKLITKKRLLYYDKVIKLHKEKGYSGLEISKIIPVNPSTITRWIRIFAEEKPCVEELKQQKASTDLFARRLPPRMTYRPFAMR